MQINLPPKHRGFFILGALLLLLFLLCVFLETQFILSRFDAHITTFFQTNIPRFLDEPLSFFSLLGNVEPTVMAVAIIGLLIYKKEKRWYFPLVFFGAIAVFELMGKFLLFHPGPPINYFRFNFPFDFPHFYVRSSFSFPSGHVSRTAFITVLGIYLANHYGQKLIGRWLIIGLWISFFGLMGFSRIYLGEHWASDVIGGAILGASMGFFALVYY